MCGIIAASSTKPINEKDIKLGMLLAEDRGGHATGFTNGRQILRSTGGVERFFEEDSELEIPPKNYTFIGHTRFATHGEKDICNVHPFVFDSIIGVHNGSIENFDDLKEEYGEHALKLLKKQYPDKKHIQEMEEVDSDSMIVYYLINKDGLKKTLPNLKGTMALIYYDKDKRLNIYRYDKPLCYGFRKGELWIASLKKYLVSLGCTNIKAFTQHCHYVIQNGQIKESNQLGKDFLPIEKSTHKIDYDSDIPFDERNKGKMTRTKTTNQTDNNEENDVKEIVNINEPLFPAPAYAKGEVNEEGKLVLWWFSEEDFNTLYTYVEGMEDVIRYDINKEDDRTLFKDDFPEIVDQVVDEYEKLETINEFRADREANLA